MAPTDPNEKEWRNHILKLLDRQHKETHQQIAGLRTEIAGLRTDIVHLREGHAALKVRAGLWGTLGGIGPGLILKFIKFGS